MKTRTIAQLLRLHSKLIDRADRNCGGKLWPIPQVFRCLDPITFRAMEQARQRYLTEVERAQNSRQL